MITRIELTNFMSHVNTVIEPAAGLTVLVGPNNCGKSALVAALQILSHNENSTYVLRHGAKECLVKVTTDDGHTIEWRRKKSASYVIDGQSFDRLRVNQVPDELLRTLLLPLVDDGSGNDPFDVHFGEQKSPIFLLDRPPSAAARFFASSSDAIRLVQMQRRHKEKLALRQRDKNRLEAESQQLNAELEGLLPVAGVDERLKEIEQQHSSLTSKIVQLAQAERDLAAIAGQQGAVERHEATTHALAPLANPPTLAPTEPLESCITSLMFSEREAARLQASSASLATLQRPPALDDEHPLAAAIDRLQSLVATANRESSAQQALQSLAHPPMLAETGELTGLVDRTTAAMQAVEIGAAMHDACIAMKPPPLLADERGFSDLLTQLATAERQVARWTEVVSQAGIQPPEVPADLQPLADCVALLERAAESAKRFSGEYDAATLELTAAEAELREFAATEICPTCGSPLDADRLLAGAAALTGGHAHG